MNLLRHLQRLRYELGSDIRSRTRVFLDTKFWILLRDAVPGTEAAALRDILEEGVGSGRLICPIEQYLFVELFKQRDAEKRAKLIPLVDSLSLKGVCLLPPHERVFVEVVEFARLTRDPEPDLSSATRPTVWMWTRVAHALGFTQLTLGDDAPADATADFERFSLEYLWSLSVAEVSELIGELPDLPFGHSAHLLNDNKQNEGLAFSSRTELYLSEIRGCFDAYGESLDGVWEVLFEEMTGGVVTQDQVVGARNQLASLLSACFRQKRAVAATLMPTCYVMASIFTEVQWDKARRYKQNDFADFGHASGALPYGDIFLTERSLKALLKNTGLTTEFGVAVASSVSEALQLPQLIQGRGAG